MVSYIDYHMVSRLLPVSVDYHNGAIVTSLKMFLSYWYEYLYMLKSTFKKKSYTSCTLKLCHSGLILFWWTIGSLSCFVDTLRMHGERLTFILGQPPSILLERAGVSLGISIDGCTIPNELLGISYDGCKLPCKPSFNKN